MAKYSVMQTTATKIAVGDMKHRIVLHTRSIRPGQFNDAGFTETYDVGLTVWSSVMTNSNANSNRRLFSNVNITEGAQPTHIFGIRYRSSITMEYVVKWRSEYYDILMVADPDETHEWLLLYCVLKGSTSKGANT